MKYTLLLITFFVASIVVYAQPSDASVKALVRKQFPNAKAIKLGGSHQEKKYEYGAWVFYYTRTFNVTIPTEYPGITIAHDGGAVFTKSGGNYSFQTYSVGETKFLGVPKPDSKEIIAFLSEDKEKFLGNYHYNNIVGEVSEITIPNDVRYNWPNLQTVELIVNVTYAEKISNTELQTAKHTYEVVLYSDGYKKPWNKFVSFEQNNMQQIISTKEYSPYELDKMKTLAEIDEIKQAKKALGDLPKIEDVPIFESEKQLFYFIHNIAMTKDANTLKSYLYKTIASSNKESEYILKQYADTWVKSVVDNLEVYKKTYCKYPIIKEEQYGQVVFYDKERRRTLTYVGEKEGDTWKLNFIRYYPAKEEDVERLESNAGQCGEKPNLEVRKEKKYDIGDVVNVTFSNGVYLGEINRKDPNFSNRYYVKLLDDGRGYWMTEDNLSPGERKTETKKIGSVSNNSKTLSEKAKSTEFKSGDAVEIETASGKMKGKVIRKVGNRYLVKFDNTRYRDMWVMKEHLLKL